MRRNYKLNLSIVLAIVLLVSLNIQAKAMEINRVNNQASTYSVDTLSWYMVAGQKKYSSSFYIEAGDSITIVVAPRVSGAKYSVGILQPSGSERKVTKTGTTTTTYAVSSSGYYKVFLHNVTSSALDYGISYTY